MIEDALQYGEAARGFYSLYAWAVMPNHVHVVFQPKSPSPDIMRWLKGRTCRLANRILGRTGMPFWQDESYDHWIRSDKRTAGNRCLCGEQPGERRTGGFRGALDMVQCAVEDRRHKTIVRPTRVNLTPQL